MSERLRTIALMRPALVVALLALAGCASAPPAPSGAAGGSAADRAASHASRMIGKPYRYGGATPAGFDCSGLVLYSYQQAGVSVPRSTNELRKRSRLVRAAELRRGDLVFFDQEGKKNSHVGIYLGKGAFVHAPSSGKSVRRDRLDNPYWKKHLSERRRF
jgi:cell wall-associated NlpC family hydrolase